MSRGGVNTAIGNVAAALADYQSAHNIFASLNITRSQAIALLNIGVLYQEAKDQRSALKYYNQALDTERYDTAIMLSIYNNRGNALKELGRHSEAEKEFRRALTLARGMRSPALVARVLRNIAREQLLTGRLDAADATIALGRKISRDGDAGAASEQFWALAAQSALQKNDLGSAARLIVKSFKNIDPAKTTLSYREAHQTAFEIFKGLGDEHQALIHLQALKRLDDKATQLASSTNTALAAARFDYANQELRIAKLKADDLQRNIDFERARTRTQQFAFVGIALVVLIIVAMLVFNLVTIGRSRNKVRAANIDLAATNAALAKALAAKTEFLATTSHEIRTPLNGILGMTQVMLADRSLGAALRDRIGIVHGAGISMRALVDDILDVAKMETGNLTIEQAPMDLKATLRDVSRLWVEQARARGIGFVLDLDSCPGWIEGDAARLRQVVFNLLSNALKFTEAGSVGVRAFTAPDAAPPMLSIAISDTGMGIPESKREMIFESFRQGDAGTARRFGGTGLGLAICRNLARAMGGDVRVAAAEGGGSVFTIEIPLVTVAPPCAAPAGAAAVRGLLIVDRSPITRSMLRAVLEARAGRVIFASSAEEAVEQIQSGAVAQVLIDDATVKACADPLAALASIARAAVAAQAVTHLLWASPGHEETRAFENAGIAHVIAKPIAGAALADALYPAGDASIRPAELVTRAA